MVKATNADLEGLNRGLARVQANVASESAKCDWTAMTLAGKVNEALRAQSESTASDVQALTAKVIALQKTVDTMQASVAAAVATLSAQITEAVGSLGKAQAEMVASVTTMSGAVAKAEATRSESG